ncbi:nucleotide sugar dehydrogenase [Diaphorobacter aerolatus]|uniref:Nucleotide sugar dehydrogenase n=1 Tax=Diaphorobacter aerolatus TaxID=1288495 RepID=A0A7H0GHX6_9BURK|nr:nucleotide sugar dehydrogenase [Diaphorobacter aerolatus]QNP47892.1 nucleotide sugar dehydrogenase [Diaphorobacter aerolatus]
MSLPYAASPDFQTESISNRIAVVGLGYVGAPLAFALAEHFPVIGFDVKKSRIEALATCQDDTGELTPEAMNTRFEMLITSDADALSQAHVYIITVPTPVKEGHVPDMSHVLSATRIVAQQMRKGSVVVYESTVYPGATEEECLPLLCATSGFSYPADFSIGYSPERINPGDRVHTLHNTVKVVSADRPETLRLLSSIYGRITEVYAASTIKVAEAAKILENTQRDVNIAVMNEVSQLFSRLGIDTHEVLEAAGTKWNFMPFKPGLVGGHCISVDPYYLSHKAAVEGYPAKLILAARETNDSMAGFLVNQLIKRLALEGLMRPGVMVTVLGASFKEDVPDIRNSKIADIVKELRRYGITTQVADPHADPVEFRHEYGFDLIDIEQLRPADAVMLNVPHLAFKNMALSLERLIERLTKTDGRYVVMDLKAVLDRSSLSANACLWRP